MEDVSIEECAIVVARPIHCSGTIVPLQWRNRATAVARSLVLVKQESNTGRMKFCNVMVSIENKRNAGESALRLYGKTV